MQFAVYLALVSAPLSHFQAEARPPVAVEAGRFDGGVGLFDPPGRLKINLSGYMSGDPRGEDTPGMDDRFPGPPPSLGEEPRLTTDSTGWWLIATPF
jgi:hypothetical protein